MSAKCAACNKPVYFNEQVNALNKKWHKHCFKCQQCGRVLSLGQQLDHKGTGPYCKMCYNSLFAPKGYGYGRAVSTFFIIYKFLGRNFITCIYCSCNQDGSER